ncbi:hypothetical protein MAM1_0298c09385 [Mucor ambiguus]|uniref:Uncharacterized protein n=1 Tax=Mucor ambiguus TaxID=91626 RepID=A0A0C9N1K0_9FUNG|nr:hypothetical protein MAM1_0298c09385 [Mucor ambiguus]
MLASVKSLALLLFCVLATLNVVSALCKQTKNDGRYLEYCCDCADKGLFGECHERQSTVCNGYRRYNGEHSCPTGQWACYNDLQNPWHG